MHTKKNLSIFLYPLLVLKVISVMLNLPAHSGRKPDRSMKCQTPIKMVGKWHYLRG